jgi:hypothetical protein
MGDVVLTNDRLVYGEKFGPTGSLIGGLAEAALEARSEKKAGGPRIAARLAEVREGTLERRRLLTERHGMTVVHEDADGWRVERA